MRPTSEQAEDIRTQVHYALTKAKGDRDSFEKCLRNIGADVEAIEADVIEQVLRAVQEDYDSARGALSTFCDRVARKRFGRLYKAEAKKPRGSVSLEDLERYAERWALSVGTFDDVLSMRLAVASIVTSLPPQERTWCELVLSGNDPRDVPALMGIVGTDARKKFNARMKRKLSNGPLKELYVERRMEPLLTLEEACSTLDMNRATLWRLVDKREVPCVRLGKNVRFRVADLDVWRALRTDRALEEVAS